jgi:threonine aldolase
VNFHSDNTAAACPEIMAAIAAANDGYAAAYGDDDWTRRLDEALGKFFGAEVRSFAVATGTAANALGLAVLTPPYGAILTHEQAHIFRDECGAPEFFSNGAQLIPVAARDAKLSVEAVSSALSEYPPSVHTVQPAVLSITQATELGTVYRPHEIAALGQLARHHGLKLHMDGARLANAIVFLECHPGDVTWRAGVDVLSFGATKNGALAAEAIVFFDPRLARDFELRRKRAGHLISKSRYVAAQLLAYVESGTWRKNAQHANALAHRLAGCAGNMLLHPVEANQVFLQLGESGKKRLSDSGFKFLDWGALDSGKARFVVSWNQPERDVDALCKALAR